MKRTTADKFSIVLNAGDLEICKSILESNPELAGRNFAPDSLHSEGFPIYQASKAGDLDIVGLLLEKGADPDAALNTQDPRELGMPLLHALAIKDYEMVHLLLDHGASLNAFPYCDTPFVDQVFNMLWAEAGSKKRVAYLMSISFHDYIAFNPELTYEVSDTDSELFRLLWRVVDLGGKASIFTVVRHQHHVLLQSLLRECPDRKGPVMDWPNETVFSNIVQAASWCGYPETLSYCKALCPSRYSTDVSKKVIERAIRSHNRDGCIDDYFELLKAELEFLECQNANSKTMISGEAFDPISVLETDFIEPKNYGFKCPHLLTTEDLERVRRLLLEYGY